ncbi:MAG: hypothetical protein SGJ05_11555 [bacterium]|nr:hypothetical protein [bacterium]
MTSSIFSSRPIRFLASLRTIGCLVIALLAFGLVESEAQTWRSLSGANPYVHRIKVWQNPTMLIALADSAQPLYENASAQLEFYSGEGYRISLDDGATWSPSKLHSFSVRDIIRMPGDGQTWIAAVIKPFVFTGGTLRSDNAGTDWPPFADNDILSIEQLHVRLADSNEVYAGVFSTSQGFQVSRDSCRTFVDRSGQLPISTRVIAFSSFNDSLVFVGGDGRGLPGVLHSTNLGLSWMQDTVGIDNKRILCILPSKFFANVLYCGTDSIGDNGAVGTGIFKSNDSGSTWFRLEGSEGKRVWHILEHPTNPAVLLAAADSAGVIASGNWGHGWEPWNDGLPQGAVVRTLELVADVLPHRSIAAYAGTYGHGVYKSSLITTDVAEDEPSANQHIRISPNPASDDVVVRTYSTAPSTSLVLLDITGRMVLTVQASTTDGFESTFRLGISELPIGSYRIVASGGQHQTVGMLSVAR